MSKSTIKALNERARQTNEPPAYESTAEVLVTGEPLAQPIHWTGHQWAVTSFGIEARDGKYLVPGGRVWEEMEGHGWIEHMAEKTWVDIHDFAEALRIARARWPERLA